jgi:hypothetical protein
VAYYLSFINVILYNYDRFVLPVCFVLAIFGGLAADRLLARAWPSRAAVAGVLALSYAYTVLYASTVDVLMLRDSRYEAERWMRPHVGSDLVAVTELPELLPGLAGFRTIAVATIDELARERPRFIVLNVDYAHAAAAGTAWADLVDGIEHERLGYRSVARFRSAAPWRWLPWAHPDLVGPRDETMVSSVLRDINPTIEVFERGD